MTSDLYKSARSSKKCSIHERLHSQHKIVLGYKQALKEIQEKLVSSRIQAQCPFTPDIHKSPAKKKKARTKEGSISGTADLKRVNKTTQKPKAAPLKLKGALQISEDALKGDGLVKKKPLKLKTGKRSMIKKQKDGSSPERMGHDSPI